LEFVNAAIDFDREAKPSAIGVDDISGDRLLAPKIQPLDLTIP
jgi:hypothetical protein